MSQHDQTSQEKKPMLNWSATGHGWFVSTHEVDIFVPEQIYDRALRAYLAEKGMERKTWAEIMKRCEAEWKKQWEAENEFRANLDQWFVSTEFGVFVRRKHHAHR